MATLKPYAKSLILLAIIVLAAISQALGADLGLDLEHYIGLLIADFLVWLVPNTEETMPTESQSEF